MRQSTAKRGLCMTGMLAIIFCCCVIVCPAYAADESVSYVTNLGGAMRACIVEGNTLYALQEPRLYIYDITDTADPIQLGTMPLPGIGRRLDKSGDVLYIACLSAGLVAVDVSDPAAPVQLSQTVFDTSAEQKNLETQDVGVRGNYAYVIDQIAGFITLDVSDPTSPSVVDTFTDFTAANYNGYDVNIAGNYLYLSCEFDGVYIFDITTPSSPSYVSRFPADPIDTSQPNNFYKSIRDGDYLYMAGGGVGFVILDVSDISSPSLAATLNNDYGGVISITKIGSSIYLCTEFSNFFEIDVSDPTNPTQVEEFDVAPYHSLDTDSSGNTIVLANRDYGLRIFDVSSGIIQQVSSIRSIGQIQDCKGSGDYAYVAGYHQGLQILDVSEPAQPVHAGTVALTGNVNGIYVSDTTVYTAQVDKVEKSGGYLEILDVSTPSSASVLASIALPGRPFDLVVKDQIAYVAAQTEGIVLVDVSDAANPELITTYDTAGSCYKIEVRGDFIIAGDGTKGSLVVDARDTSVLRAVSGGFDNGTIQDIAVWETFVLSSGGDTGLTITDISSPAEPLTAAVIPTETLGYEVMNIKAATAFDSYLLTIETTGDTGQVRMFDISDPMQPKSLAVNRSMFGDAIKISYSPDQQLAYGSSQIAGLFIYRVEPARTAAVNIDGRWVGSGSGSGGAIGIAADIDQARTALSGEVTVFGQTDQSGILSGTVSDNGSVTATVTFDDGSTVSVLLSYSASSGTLAGSMSGAVSLSGIEFEPAGMRGQLPFMETASLLSSSISDQLSAGAGPVETFLLQQAASALNQGLAAEDLSEVLAGASVAELYLGILNPSGETGAADSYMLTSALWDTAISQAIVQRLTANICPQYKNDLKDLSKRADRLFSLGQRLAGNGRKSLALRALSRAADLYGRAVSQYDSLSPQCPTYDIAEFDGYYEGTIDFGFAIGEVRFCVEQADNGTVTGGAIIEIAATGEKMGGLLKETVNETVNNQSVLNGYIQVFVGSTEAHVLMIDWKHDPSTDQWEGAVDVDLQPVNATAAVKKVSDDCPDTWDDEFAEVTGD